VYQLVTQCFYKRQQHTAYEIIKSYKKRIRKNKTTIKVSDLGSGSRIFKSSERKVSKIGKFAGTKLKRAKLLNRIVRYLNILKALELGTSVGLGSVAIAAGNETTSVLTIEGCPETAKLAKENIDSFNFENIKILNEDFETIIPKLQTSFDLIFIDGNHTKDATLNYFKSLLPLSHNDTVYIFDDIYLNRGMTEAWEEIKAHDKVTVTIDTFKWGFVFLRQEQAKEHFVIRV
jgi:predicted O-methyltransferase YrrM